MSSIPILTVQEQYEKQKVALMNAAATTIDSCLVAQYVAASDSRVRELFFQKIADRHQFRRLYCVERISLPENKYVIFDFQCADGILCFVPPAFMVVVDILDRHVVTIVDPYTPTAFRVTANSNASNGPCECHDNRYVSEDPITALSGIIDAVFGQGITCAIVNRRCGNDQRCNRSFQKLRNFHNNPSAETARDLADFMGASSMQERCIRAIIEEANTVQWIVFIAAVAAAAA